MQLVIGVLICMFVHTCPCHDEGVSPPSTRGFHKLGGPEPAQGPTLSYAVDRAGVFLIVRLPQSENNH
jgi:hypothetical protein